MGLFSMIMNGLFGKQKEAEVKGVGVITCKVCDWYQAKDYTWSGDVRLPGYSGTTFFLIDGDARGADYMQEISLQKLVPGWNQVIVRLNELLPDKALAEGKADMYADWQKRFFPESILPVAFEPDSWEIVFNGLGEFEKEYFSFIWQSEDVKELAFG